MRPFLALLALLTASASAAYAPEEVVTENRDGRQLIVKIYTLSPQDDPAGLVQPPFDLDGFHYAHMETTREEQKVPDSRQHRETVTVETATNDLAAILAELPPSREYAQDGYAGILTLDHTTLKTEASGYVSRPYTITDTRQYTGLERNDPACVPATIVKDGTTLSLSHLRWSSTGTGLYGSELLPATYTATATYTAAGSRKAAAGYVTTADYTGTITAEEVRSIRYTVTYLGTPIAAPEPEPGLPAAAGVMLWVSLAALAAGCAAAVLLLRPNAVIYAMNARGVAYKRLGAQRLTVRRPELDFTKLREYPAAEASVELKPRLARSLAGRLVTIRLYDGTKTHLVEGYDGPDSYWFAVKEEKEENGT